MLLVKIIKGVIKTAVLLWGISMTTDIASLTKKIAVLAADETKSGFLNQGDFNRSLQGVKL